VTFELDLFWATKAGRDPIALFDAHPGRFPLWHVKDMRDVRRRAGDGRRRRGRDRLRRIFAAARQSGMEHFFAEHDKPDRCARDRACEPRPPAPLLR
jgi:sugar phosphate isomerase/epimerase